MFWSWFVSIIIECRWTCLCSGTSFKSELALFSFEMFWPLAIELSIWFGGCHFGWYAFWESSSSDASLVSLPYCWCCSCSSYLCSIWLFIVFRKTRLMEDTWIKFKWCFEKGIFSRVSILITYHFIRYPSSILLNKYLTLGTVSLAQIPSRKSLSLISHAKMEGHSRLYFLTCLTTTSVATRGFEPPIAFGRIVPIS